MLYTKERANGSWTETEAFRVYRTLKREILSATFAPGQPLAEIELAHRFGSSRTPLREALLRLEADGLVRIEPRRGAFVLELTVADFLEINEIRSILEPYAARSAALRIDPTIVQRLQSRLIAVPVDRPSEDDLRQLEALDSDVHVAIAEASGNKRLCRLIRGLDDMMEVMRIGDMRRRHREMHESIGEILTALRARNADAAEALLRRHVSDFSGAIADMR